MQKFFLTGGWRQYSNSLFPTSLIMSETSLARKFIFRLQVNTDKTNDRRYDGIILVESMVQRRWVGGQGEEYPSGASKEVPKGGAVIFFATRYTKILYAL